MPEMILVNALHLILYQLTGQLMSSFKNIFLNKINQHPLKMNLFLLAIFLCLIIAGYSNTFNEA